MTLTEQEKMAALTVMIITYGDGNSVPMYGLLRRDQRIPKMPKSRRMSLETANFNTHVENHSRRNNVLMAQVYVNTFLDRGRFVPCPENLMREWRSGFWVDVETASQTRFNSPN